MKSSGTSGGGDQLSFGFVRDSDSESTTRLGRRAGLRWIDEEGLGGHEKLTFDTYEELYETARSCTRCGLREGCKQVVVGDGSTEADLLFVGEAPGGDEDRLGKPFVGRAGELLDRIFAAAGFKRSEVYITNAVLCRPPGNRTPTVGELRTCEVYLDAHTRLIKPKIIVAMGSTAVRALVDPNARITRMRGTWQECRGIPVMPTFHPAALLRDPGKKRPVWEDFKALRDRYHELREQAGY